MGKPATHFRQKRRENRRVLSNSSPGRGNIHALRWYDADTDSSLMDSEATATLLPRNRASNHKPPSLSSIRRPVEEELKVFRRTFRETMRSDVGLLDKVTRYVLRRKGKQIRPTLVLLSAKACGRITDGTYRAAALVELLHTATLVHDDVVDGAETRRGMLSIYRLWKSRVSVLFGDYLLSRGLLLALDGNAYELLHIVSDAVKRMSEGELLQIQKSQTLDIDEATYFRIISDKTASLIAACLACGAASADVSSDTVNQMKEVGESLGQAFQIRDDLFDYDAVDVGKPVGLDLHDRKMTLPLIASLDHAAPDQQKHIRKLVRKRRKKRSEIDTIVSFVRSNGGIEVARNRMAAFIEEAIEGLNTLPPSDARDALIELAHYIVARKR